MKRYSFPIFLLIGAITLWSCSKEEDPTLAVLPCDDSPMTKVVKIGDEVESDCFLVKFKSVPTEEDLSSIASDAVLSIHPLFHSTPGKEQLEAQFGLDRWYEIQLKRPSHLDREVFLAADLESVQMVQYSALAKKDSDCAVYAAPQQPATKAVASSFNDPYLQYQWHYKNNGDLSYSRTSLAGADINVADVWKNLCCGDPSIIVAVVDEGVKYTHTDLKDNMWVNTGEIPSNGIDDDHNGYVDDVYGYNFVADGPISWTVVDENGDGDSGHGTHCAGTIAAVNNNGKGVAGVAGGSGNGDGCRIMSCQIFSGNEGGNSRVIAPAIKYAADMGASVISCSFGFKRSFSSDNDYLEKAGSAEIDAIHYFEASCNNDVLNGNIAIFSSGNNAHPYAHYPGAFYDIISVSAFGPDGLPTYYTDFGPGCNITAPGGEAYHVINKWNSMVLSTVPSELEQLGINGELYETGMDYAYMQGTSMACPHVSGVVALGLSYAHKLGKHFDRDVFKQMILSSVNDIDQRINKTPQKTYAYYQKPLELTQFYHQMGTGMIDAWRLMMKIEGTPTLTAQTGRQQWIDLTSIFGTASVSLTYLDVEVSSAVASSLGLQEIKPTNTGTYPAVQDKNNLAYIQFGRLYIYPTKIGSGKITIKAIGGGSHVGGGDNPPGGMELSQEISLIARDTDGGNGTGGWL